MGYMTETDDIILDELAEDTNCAIEWMKEIDRIRCWTTSVGTSRSTSFRVFMTDECCKITCDAQDYLLSLERSGIIDADTRELAIDSAMLHDDELMVDLPMMKATVFMVLVNNLLEQDEIKQLHSIIFDQSGVQH